MKLRDLPAFLITQPLALQRFNILEVWVETDADDGGPVLAFKLQADPSVVEQLAGALNDHIEDIEQRLATLLTLHQSIKKDQA